MHAVITAGGRVDDAFAHVLGTPVKALAPLGEHRLIDAAISAARGLDVEGIAVIGDADVRRYCGDRVDIVIDADDDGVENIRRALHAFTHATRLLYLTSDLPFVDAYGLRHFLTAAGDAPLAMALSSGDAYDAEFPGAPAHTITFGRERVANGSVFAIDASAIAPLERLAGRFFEARKNLARLALLLGPLLSVQFALKQLRIEAIERRARGILGFEARAIRDCSPGLCYDVDSIEDWAYAHSRALADV